MSFVKMLWLYQEAGILVGISLTHLYGRLCCSSRLVFGIGPSYTLPETRRGGSSLPFSGSSDTRSPKTPNLRGQTEVNWLRILSTSQKNQRTLSQIQRVREGNKNTWQKQLKERRGVYFRPQLEGTAIMAGKVLTGALKQLVTLYPHSSVTSQH